MIRAILDYFFARRQALQTATYLDHITSSTARASRVTSTKLIDKLAAGKESKIILGHTDWNQELAVPISDLTAMHSMITGTTGAGKSRFALQIIKGLLSATPPRAFAVLDPKNETYAGTLALLAQRVHELRASDPLAASALCSRIVILDFASSDGDPVSEYNVLARSHDVDPGFFAENRASLLLDLLPAGDSLSLAGAGLLRHAIALCAELKLPITLLTELLNDASKRIIYLRQSEDSLVKEFFGRQFASIPPQTIAALSRRLDALLASNAVRRSLGGSTAPQMRAIQDDGRILLVNSFSANLTRSVRRLLQAIVFVDFSTAIFSRRHSNRPYFLMIDESSDLFVNEHLRDHLRDCAAKARSFGTHMCLISQGVSPALGDPQVFTNLGWTFTMRGDPAQAAYLKSALPVTGRKLQPQSHPFEEPRTFTLNDERTIELNSLASLPNRKGFFWLRGQSNEAIKITTAQLDLPHCAELDELLVDPRFGERVSREKYEKDIAARNTRWKAREDPSVAESLTESYRRMRGVDR
jgi:hypothetical protein